MSPEQQRIAIAEALGYTQEESWLDGRDCWSHKDHPPHAGFDVIPDYLHDLNACREFEEKLIALGPPALDTYEIFLLASCTRAGNRIFRATAAQRAESFLKTLDKWTNDN